MICGSCMSFNDAIFEPYVGLSLTVLDSVENTDKDYKLKIEDLDIDIDSGPSKKMKLSGDDVMEIICQCYKIRIMLRKPLHSGLKDGVQIYANVTIV